MENVHRIVENVWGHMVLRQLTWAAQLVMAGPSMRSFVYLSIRGAGRIVEMEMETMKDARLERVAEYMIF